jgi:quercetin dioxygenase-like cupin family protein
MDSIARQHLGTMVLTDAPDQVQAHRVVFAPGQRSGVHRHPGGVVGVIMAGRALLDIAGDVKQLTVGDIFIEPPGAIIASFDNASGDEPLEFIAIY